jgi:hypothetical protein
MEMKDDAIQAYSFPDWGVWRAMRKPSDESRFQPTFGSVHRRVTRHRAGNDYCDPELARVDGHMSSTGIGPSGRLEEQAGGITTCVCGGFQSINETGQMARQGMAVSVLCSERPIASFYGPPAGGPRLNAESGYLREKERVGGIDAVGATPDFARARNYSGARRSRGRGWRKRLGLERVGVVPLASVALQYRLHEPATAGDRH